MKLKAYKCPAGVWTIGYGHTGKVKEGDLITAETAEKLLLKDVLKFEKGVTKLLKVEVTDNQFNALVSFAFNLGLNNLKNSTLLRMINAGDANIAGPQFLRWVYAGGKKLKGLIRRRKEEKGLFEALS